MKGQSIPFGSRIIAAADAYCAMTSDRPYRKAFDIDTAIELMIDEVKNFDMEIFLAFQRVVYYEQDSIKELVGLNLFKEQEDVKFPK